MPRTRYGQYCPVAKAAEILTERWMPLILRDLLAGSRRFNELRRGVPLISPTLLSDRLRQLERSGLVRRSRASAGRHWEYHLTDAGEECRPLIDLMKVWGQRWALRHITPEELDPALLMWVFLRQARLKGLRPEMRVVILFDITDAPKGKHYWWLVFDPPDVDLCLSEPGFAVDLTWRSSARAMASITFGETTVGGAHRSKTITLEGPPRLRRSLPAWLGFEQVARSTH